MGKIKSFILVAVMSGILGGISALFFSKIFNKYSSSNTGIIQPALAQSQTTLPRVTGSPNVAVAAYKINGSATFILWADGSVTNVGSLPHIQTSLSDPNRPSGSTGVAVGIVENSVTPGPPASAFILYSNGDIKQYP